MLALSLFCVVLVQAITLQQFIHGGEKTHCRGSELYTLMQLLLQSTACFLWLQPLAIAFGVFVIESLTFLVKKNSKVPGTCIV
jgi:hypothetical protein